MEAAGPINQESARVENVVPEVRPNICNELLECHSAKLQRVANQPERMLVETLAFTVGESYQFRFR